MIEVQVVDDIQPPPKKVIITMTIEEARVLHNQAYAALPAPGTVAPAALHNLVDALTAAEVQLP